MESANRCTFRAGEIIDHKYRVSSVLGEGSFGVVYQVSANDGSMYALKLLKLWEVPADIRKNLIARFDMEFETGLIKSPYLVRSVSHGLTFDNPYIVMEYCPGGDLYKISNAQGLDLIKVSSCVLKGLKALHENGKVHRDLKPENVLLKSDGSFALTDFGISGDRNKRMTERNILGKPNQIFGTYAYMPPEQVNPNKDATVLPTTDIFSFGVMMYQLITGELPFGQLNDERSLVGYLKNSKSGNWNRRLLQQQPDGTYWSRMIEGCLHPDFHRRLQSATEVLSFLPSSIEDKEDLQYDNYEKRIINGLLLRVMQGDEYGNTYYLDNLVANKGNSILTMGRSCDTSRNDIDLVERHSCYISRKHCTLELDYEIGEWVIRDGQWQSLSGTGCWKSSTNGTFVNSSEISTMGHILKPGDIISIGDSKLRVEAY